MHNVSEYLFYGGRTRLFAVNFDTEAGGVLTD